MLLEGLLLKELAPVAFQMITTVISQMQLMLSLVNGVMDIKLIEQGKFEVDCQNFNPANAFAFILAIFRPQLDVTETGLVFEMVAPQVLEVALEHGHNRSLMP